MQRQCANCIPSTSTSTSTSTSFCFCLLPCAFIFAMITYRLSIISPSPFSLLYRPSSSSSLRRIAPPPLHRTSPPLVPLPLPLPLPAFSFSCNGAFNDTSSEAESYDDDINLCPVDCVTEFKTDDEFQKLLRKAKHTGALVVVDFYRTSCGSCKYIERGFKKMCKGAGVQLAPVLFLKHNVIDEDDELSEVAHRLRIKVVPLFHFYKDGVLLEAFATREKDKIIDAIRKYT